MIECESTAKKWGNSIGIIIPKEVTERQGIRENTKVHFAILDNAVVGERLFGMLKGWKEPTGKALKRLRREGWHD